MRPSRRFWTGCKPCAKARRVRPSRAPRARRPRPHRLRHVRLDKDVLSAAGAGAALHPCFAPARAACDLDFMPCRARRPCRDGAVYPRTSAVAADTRPRSLTPRPEFAREPVRIMRPGWASVSFSDPTPRTAFGNRFSSSAALQDLVRAASRPAAIAAQPSRRLIDGGRKKI